MLRPTQGANEAFRLLKPFEETVFMEEVLYTVTSTRESSYTGVFSVIIVTDRAVFHLCHQPCVKQNRSQSVAFGILRSFFVLSKPIKVAAPLPVTADADYNYQCHDCEKTRVKHQDNKVGEVEDVPAPPAFLVLFTPGLLSTVKPNGQGYPVVQHLAYGHHLDDALVKSVDVKATVVHKYFFETHCDLHAE